MNIQEAIEIAVREDRRVTFECHDSNESIRDSVSFEDQKGCALMRPFKESTEVTVWPPSQCIVLQDQGKSEIWPKCFA